MSKNPLLSGNESGGSFVIWRKISENESTNGVFPTPYRQFFEIHGSKFKPDPSCDSGQASVVCITHRVSFLRVRKDPFNRLLALCVNCFRTIRFSYLLHEIQILLPDVRRMDFLPLFICTAFRFARSASALLRRASVGPLSIPVRRSVPQDPAPWAGIGVIRRIVGIFPRLVSVLPPGVSCIRKHRDAPVL